MRTALDTDPSRLDTHERKFVADIRKYGWVGTHVFADHEGPGFGYSTGLWVNLSFPEVIMFSLTEKIRHDTLWHLFREIKSGNQIELRKSVDGIFENLPAVLIPVAVHELKEYCGWSRWFYGGDNFHCLQLVWPDANGVFPWQPRFNAALADDQPDLSDGHWSGLANH